jgi:hypothetical protein
MPVDPGAPPLDVKRHPLPYINDAIELDRADALGQLKSEFNGTVDASVISAHSA